jgi:hypothetical protein
MMLWTAADLNRAGCAFLALKGYRSGTDIAMCSGRAHWAPDTSACLLPRGQLPFLELDGSRVIARPFRSAAISMAQTAAVQHQC